MSKSRPLVLDVDGTFLKTDLLFECFGAGLGKDPFRVIAASLRLFFRRAALKKELADIAQLRIDLLPVHPDLKQIAEQESMAGREVMLASAADRSLVERLAAYHGLSERVFASDGNTNLKGSAKAGDLVSVFGEGGFDYAGNERTDVAIGNHAENALIVGDQHRIRDDLVRRGKKVTEIKGGWRSKDLIRALRPHQWVKNVLLLLPMLAAHQFSFATLWLVLVGAAAFSVASSCIYIVNDLLDLEADRLHPTKHRRPFASGAVPIRVGMAASAGLCLVALGLSALLGLTFLAIVVAYMILSLAYSLRLKRTVGRYCDPRRTIYVARGCRSSCGSGFRFWLYAVVRLPGFHFLGLCQASDRAYAGNFGWAAAGAGLRAQRPRRSLECGRFGYGGRDTDILSVHAVGPGARSLSQPVDFVGRDDPDCHVADTDCAAWIFWQTGL